MKKIITFLLLLISITAGAQQKYTLLQKSWNRPAVFTDTITKEHLKNGYYPVSTDQLDSLLKFVGVFRKINKLGLNRTYFDNDDYKTKNITFEITNVAHAYGDTYDIYIMSNTDAGTFKMKLADNTEKVYTTQNFIKEFYDYLKNAIKERDKLKK